MLRDEIQVGDRVLFYHSNAKPPAVAGIAQVVRAGYPDPTAFDPQSKHFDPKSDPQNPTWYMVDIRLVEKFPTPVPLNRLKSDPRLEGMLLLQRGCRLSVQPVSSEQFAAIVGMVDR